MDPMTMASLMQMAMAKGEGLGAAFGGGGQEAWGDFFGGSVLGGYLKGRSAKKEQKKAKKRFDKALKLTESIQGRTLQQQEALSRLATSQRVGGYDTAKKEASRLGRTSAQGALDRGQQLEARASQGLASRGLGSTTVGANLSRGIAADTSRQMQSINEGLAGIYGDLALGRSGAEAMGTDQLSALAGAKGDLFTQLGQMRALKGQTLGSTGTYDPMAWGPYRVDSTTPMMEGMGSMFGGMGGGGGQGGLSMEQLQWLFGGGGR